MLISFIETDTIAPPPPTQHTTPFFLKQTYVLPLVVSNRIMSKQAHIFVPYSAIIFHVIPRQWLEFHISPVNVSYKYFTF